MKHYCPMLPTLADIQVNFEFIIALILVLILVFCLMVWRTTCVRDNSTWAGLQQPGSFSTRFAAGFGILLVLSLIGVYLWFAWELYTTHDWEPLLLAIIGVVFAAIVLPPVLWTRSFLIAFFLYGTNPSVGFLDRINMIAVAYIPLITLLAVVSYALFYEYCGGRLFAG